MLRRLHWNGDRDKFIEVETADDTLLTLAKLCTLLKFDIDIYYLDSDPNNSLADDDVIDLKQDLAFIPRLQENLDKKFYCDVITGIHCFFVALI